MEFTTTPGRKINRDGKIYIADDKGTIISDTKEIQALFEFLGFKSKSGTVTPKVENNSTREEYIKTFGKKPGNKSEDTMRKEITEFNNK